MRATVALCVLGLLAAALAEDSAETEPVDDDVERQREVRETGDVDTETVRRRQKRHSQYIYILLMQSLITRAIARVPILPDFVDVTSVRCPAWSCLR